MNMICSAGKGLVTQEECLACALAGAPCHYPYSLVKKLWVNQESRPDIHVSDIVNCLLKAYMQKVEPRPIYLHDLLVMWYGTVIHEQLEEDETVSEIELKYKNLVGRADYFKDGLLRDYKTTRWLDLSKLPYGSHVEQLNVYSFMLEEMGYEVKEIQLVYLDLSGPARCPRCKLSPVYSGGELICPKCGASLEHAGVYTMQVEKFPHEEMERYINDRLYRLTDALENDYPPVGEPGFMCRYCSFTDCLYRKGG